MAASSSAFPWPGHYGHFQFVEAQLNGHDKVVSINNDGGGVYSLVRLQGDTLRILVCECYSFGVAEYLEVVNNLGKVDVVIINSAWCGYTDDVKQHCRSEKVGVFKIGEFMSAINKNQYWMHLSQREQDEIVRKQQEKKWRAV